MLQMLLLLLLWQSVVKRHTSRNNNNCFTLAMIFVVVFFFFCCYCCHSLLPVPMELEPILPKKKKKKTVFFFVLVVVVVVILKISFRSLLRKSRTKSCTTILRELMINPAAAVAVAATADVVALFCCPPKTIHYNCYTDETFSSSSSTLSLFPF